MERSKLFVQLVKISLKYLCEAKTENPHENATSKMLLKQNEKITQKDLRWTIYDGERWERERERDDPKRVESCKAVAGQWF